MQLVELRGSSGAGSRRRGKGILAEKIPPERLYARILLGYSPKCIKDPSWRTATKYNNAKKTYQSSRTGGGDRNQHGEVRRAMPKPGPKTHGIPRNTIQPRLCGYLKLFTSKCFLSSAPIITTSLAEMSGTSAGVASFNAFAAGARMSPARWNTKFSGIWGISSESCCPKYPSLASSVVKASSATLARSPLDSGSVSRQVRNTSSLVWKCWATLV
ncbi:hypothetical protein C8R47DRAFT_275752 [Mycena vitilis]|nr:hypothetical protein C8R47DRAFT_275752 [Mycena vitilis]